MLAELIKKNAKRLLGSMSNIVDWPWSEKPLPDAENRENARRVLRYLSELALVGRQRVSNIETNADYLRYGSRLHLPGIQENQVVDGECAWLTVDRLKPELPPELPSILHGWVSVPDKPALKPTLSPKKNIKCREDVANEMLVNDVARSENVHNMSDDNGMRAVVLLWEDQPRNVKESFKLYLSSEWSQWAEQEEPRRESIKIYEKLHDYYRMIEGMDETDRSLELVFGLGIAKKYNNNAPEYILSVVEQLGEIKLDTATAQIAVYPCLSIKPTIALDAFQDQQEIEQVKDVFQSICDDENFELKPWDTATYSRIAEAAKACLARDAQIANDEVDTKDAQPDILTFYMDYAVFVRKHDEGRGASVVANAFDEHIQSAEGVNSLPPTLTRLVGTQDNEGNNVNPVPVANEDDGADRYDNVTRYYLPLPCNKEQKDIIKKLESNCAGVVVQGPPGTGKSHTIANIICHYLARGRRVLVTSHAAPALSVLRDKLPEAIRPFAIPVLGTDVDSKKEMEHTLYRLLEIHGQSDLPDSEILEKRAEILLAQKLRLEERIKSLAKKILAPPPTHLFVEWNEFTADECTTEHLAIWCAENRDNFSWFVDRPPIDSKSAREFAEGDIAQLREARQLLGNDLRYVGKTLPKMQGLPSAMKVVEWHENFKKADAIEAGNIPRYDLFGFRTFNVQRRLKKTRREQQKTFSILDHAEGDITESMLEFLQSRVGSQEEATTISREWARLKNLLESICQTKHQRDVVVDITTKLEDAGAKKWANTLRTTPATDDGIDIPNNWREAWRWGCAKAYLDSIDSNSSIRDSAENLVQIRKDMESNTKRIVEAHVIRSSKTRIDDNTALAQGLADFQTAMNIMPGPGAITETFVRRRAQQALEKCYPAIPCWVMPWNKVNEMLPKVLGAFDLVVVDEASQSGITELLSLWRGKKALVIGDDKQVSPTEFLKFSDLERLFDTHTGDLPNRNTLSPTNSLFDVARSLFADKFVMLCEHFRCAEPIIKFSSRHFYGDKILPLRVPTATERLSPPLVCVYVPNGFKDDRKVNKQEACGIVEEIQRIVNTPTMDKRTIGVISLLGQEQVRHIWTELRSKIPWDKINRHKIVCGSAAHFQGKERDIVLLSMVASHGRATALTRNVFKQMYNVAVSRARDRLYLFHSVPSEQLNNRNDMQRLLLEHFSNPMPNVSADNGENLCESGFERKVFRKLAAKGYAVLPQVGSRNFRIDLVVEGQNGQRLAIELDGDMYHQDFEKDYQRQQILERAGWTFWRCFSSTYIGNPDGVFQDLLNKLQIMGIEPWQRDQDVVNRYTEFREFLSEEDKHGEENDTACNEEQNRQEGATAENANNQGSLGFA